MDSEFWLELLGTAAIEGVLLGAVLGLIWAMATKALQWFLLGQFILLKWLESRGILTVDWERLTMGLMENSGRAVDEIISVTESVVELGMFGASVALGFYLVQKVKS